MKSIITCLVLMLFLTSCNNKNSNSKLFIGTYRSMDELIPYPYIIKQKRDSVILFNNKGLIIDIAKDESIALNDTIKFKNAHYFICNKQTNQFIAYDLKDTTNFEPLKKGSFDAQLMARLGAKFQKIDSKHNLNAKRIKDEILNTIWKYKVIEDENSNPNNDLDIEQLLYFHNDSLSVITNYYYQGSRTASEYERKSYHIYKIDDALFLSFEKEDNNPQPVFQIVEQAHNRIELLDFSSTDAKTIEFVKSNIEIKDFLNTINRTPRFSNCFDGYQGEYYYGDDVTFNKGNEFILNFVNKEAPKTDRISGYIIVHFNVNCNGSIGKFGLIQMDRKYQETSFSKEMVYHIFDRVSQLKDWPSSHSPIEWLFYKDVHAFLMFKVENGKIVDVCP